MTVRQKRVLKLVDKGGLASISQAMIQAGYSPATAHNPQKVTKAQGWLKLLDQMLPDDELLQVTREALKADKIFSPPDAPNEIIPDHAIRLKASEQGYKLKGRLNTDNSTNIQVNVAPILGGKTKDVPGDNSHQEDPQP